MKDLIKVFKIPVVILLCCGFNKLKEVLKDARLFAKMLFSVLIDNADLLGLTDFIKTYVIYIIACIAFAFLGIRLYKKQKQKVYSIISFIISIISFISMFAI